MYTTSVKTIDIGRYARGTYVLPHIIKIKPWLYKIGIIILIFTILVLATLLFIIIWGAIASGTWPDNTISLVAEAGFILIFIGWGTLSYKYYNICLLEDKLVFKTLLSRKEIEYSDISKIIVTLQHRESPIGEPKKCDLYIYNNRKERAALTIHEILRFSEGDLAIMFNTIAIKAPQVNAITIEAPREEHVENFINKLSG